jgi:LuxR family quorum-sensing system transcriptional regulator SolR
MIWAKDDIFDLLSAAETLGDLRQSLMHVSHELGFAYCCYGLRLPVPVSQRPLYFVDGYPQGWIRHYCESGYLHIDPVVRLGSRSSAPLLWSELRHVEAEPMWRDARDFGLRIGVSQSSWAAPGTFGMLSLARDKEPVSKKELRTLAPLLADLTSMTHAAMRRLFAAYLDESAIELTHREQEVLRWTGEGKTAIEIGEILSISPRTVNFHAYNAMAKLSANNRTQAAVKAFSLGLIS